MTSLAQVRSENVVRRLAFGRHPIMARKAIIGYAIVIKRRDDVPRRNDVAGVAFRCGRRMARRFALGSCPIVATRTGAYHLIVINPQCRLERAGTMAGLTSIGGANMGGTLAPRRSATDVAAHAVVYDTGVIERCGGQPRHRGVANIAFRGRPHMIGRLTFGDGAIVAACTHAYNLVVIHSTDLGKRHRVMTCFTHVCRANVLRVLAGGLHAVMATDTISRNPAVVESRRRPGNGRMARVTLLGSGDMPGILTRSNHAIVAAGATTQYLGVVDAGGTPKIGNVAVFAQVRAGDVGRRLAGGLDSVVTAHTAACHRGMVKRARGEPGAAIGVMTHIARHGSWDVIGGLAIGHNPVMAAAAGCRRAGKHAAQVTRFTGRVGMSAFKGKSSCQMVEGRWRIRLTECHAAAGQEKKK